jgi:hypothetical protein
MPPEVKWPRGAESVQPVTIARPEPARRNRRAGHRHGAILKTILREHGVSADARMIGSGRLPIGKAMKVPAELLGAANAPSRIAAFRFFWSAAAIAPRM